MNSIKTTIKAQWALLLAFVEALVAKYKTRYASIEAKYFKWQIVAKVANMRFMTNRAGMAVLAIPLLIIGICVAVYIFVATIPDAIDSLYGHSWNETVPDSVKTLATTVVAIVVIAVIVIALFMVLKKGGD